MRIVQRQYRQVAPEPDGFCQDARPFSAFQSRPAVVVIGDPGAGKTTSFKDLCAGDSSAAYISIADVLEIPTSTLHEMFDGKTVYLDGLDECRAKSGEEDVLGRIRKILFELGRPKFRLSCRSADWYGGMDASRLQDLSTNRELVVLRLEPLTSDQIKEAIRDEIDDPNEFINQAEKYGVTPLLGNPQTLQMLVSVVKSSGSWPSTRADLYNRATRLLAEEFSPWHSRTSQGKISDDAVLLASGRMYATMLMGASVGFSLVRSAASAHFPLITDAFGDDPLCQAAARRRVFASEGPERIGSPHRTVAEYLAARYLVEHVRKGFPLSRVLALVTCPDGAVVPMLRGMFAWMCALCSEHAELLVARDPMGVVIYGDASILPRTSKIALLKAFDVLANADPWFRAEDWSSSPFGGLASADMDDVLEGYLRSARQRSPTVLSCVLDALQHGEPMSGLGNLLLKMSQDNGIADHLREDALAAFIHCCPARQRELLGILQEVVDGEIQDASDMLRGFILRTLYPTVISPNAVVAYISKPSEHHIGGYAMFIDHEMLDATPKECLADLADSVATAPQRSKKMGRGTFWGEFAGAVLLKALQEEGERVPAARLYRWLGMDLDEHGYPFSRFKQSEGIRKWLQEHPDRIKELFDIWLAEEHVGRMAGDYRVFIEHRLHQADPPSDLAAWLLNKAASMGDEDKMANELFVKATDIVISSRGAPTLTFDDLCVFIEKHPRFENVFLQMCRCEIPDWRWKHNAMQQEHEMERKQNIAKRTASLESRLAHIRMGDDWGALPFLGQCYFSGHSERDRKKSPLDRVADETTPEIAAAAADGFKNVLKKPISLTPRDVGVTAAKSKSYNASHVVRAGMRLLNDESQDLLTDVPENNIRLAAAFCFEGGNNDHDKPWMRVLVDRVPELVAQTMIDYARPQLEKHGKDYVSGISALTYDLGMPEVARLAVPTLLADYPNAKPQVLRGLLQAGLAYCSQDEMLALAHAALKRKGAVRGASRALWMGVAYMLAPSETEGALTKYIGRSEEKILNFLSVMELPLQRDSKIDVRLAPRCLGITIKLSGRLFHPEREFLSGTVSNRHQVSRTIGSMITTLANMTGAEATSTLQQLVSDGDLAAWRDSLRHALQDHLRKERESSFIPPNVVEVSHALAGGLPANAADLRALVCNELREIGNELRHGATGGYKAFWNTTTRGRLVSPKGEEECRDVLVDRLRSQLGRLGIRVEPEARYAEFKRADIKVMSTTCAVPVEVKRHMNSELWSAPVEQLAGRYIDDPEASGYGVYLVLYYGTGKGIKALPLPPKGSHRPKDPCQLETTLRDFLPARLRGLLEIVVLDVSRHIRKGLLNSCELE